MTTRTLDNSSSAPSAALGRPELIDAALQALAKAAAQGASSADRHASQAETRQPPRAKPSPETEPPAETPADRAARPPSRAAAGDAKPQEHFVPQEPKSFQAAGLNDNLVESLALKYLMAHGDATGREVADQLKLPFLLVDELLRGLKNDRLVGYRGGGTMNDFVYQLTEVGRERAKRYWNHCTYFGSAPVSLEDYIASVKAQSLTRQQTTADAPPRGLRRPGDERAPAGPPGSRR